MELRGKERREGEKGRRGEEEKRRGDLRFVATQGEGGEADRQTVSLSQIGIGIGWERREGEGGIGISEAG